MYFHETHDHQTGHQVLFFMTAYGLHGNNFQFLTTMVATFIGDNFLWVNFLGVIFLGVIFKGAIFRGGFSEVGTFIAGYFHREQFWLVAIFWGEIFWVQLFTGQFSGGQFSLSRWHTSHRLILFRFFALTFSVFTTYPRKYQSIRWTSIVVRCCKLSAFCLFLFLYSF